MPTLNDLGIVLFNKNESRSANETRIIYGTALADSANGEVLVALDNAIYALGDDESNYE